MGTYYLVARNRNDNTFTVLKLQETWYLGREKGHEDVFTRGNDLEAIDLVTTRFGSETEMAERMAMHGYIPNSNVDIFIASKRKKNGKSYIKFDEVLYNHNEKRNSAIRRVALTSLVSDFKNNSFDLESIYDEVISLAYSADDYLDMLLEGEMNVPKSFAEQLRTIKEQPDVPLELKDKAGFGAADYATVRNIVESINRLECLGCSSREDRFILNGEFIEANIGKRIALVPELSVVLDKDYVEGQLSLFSDLDEGDKKKVMAAAEAVVEEENLIPAKIKVDRSLENADKRKEIYRILRGLPVGAIYKESRTEEFKVNLDMFPHCPLASDESKKLSTYLTGNLPKYFAWYMRDYRLLCDANSDGFTPNSEIAEMQRDVEFDIKRIDNRFKSSKCLNMAYEWCVIMEGALKRDKAVSEGAKVVTDTDEKAKVYEKKQQSSE